MRPAGTLKKSSGLLRRDSISELNTAESVRRTSMRSLRLWQVRRDADGLDQQRRFGLGVKAHFPAAARQHGQEFDAKPTSGAYTSPSGRRLNGMSGVRAESNSGAVLPMPAGSGWRFPESPTALRSCPAPAEWAVHRIDVQGVLRIERPPIGGTRPRLNLHHGSLRASQSRSGQKDQRREH